MRSNCGCGPVPNPRRKRKAKKATTKRKVGKKSKRINPAGRVRKIAKKKGSLSGKEKSFLDMVASFIESCSKSKKKPAKKARKAKKAAPAKRRTTKKRATKRSRRSR